MQKDLNVIFAYTRPSLGQGYSQYTCSVVLKDLRVIPLYPTVFMLLMAEALVIVALPFEKLLIVENTVELPIERCVALKAQFLFAVFAAETGFVKNDFVSCHSFHWVNWFQTGWACFLSGWLKLQSHRRVNTPPYHKFLIHLIY